MATKNVHFTGDIVILNKLAAVLGILVCLSGKQDVNDVRSEIADSPTAQRVADKISNSYDSVGSLQQKTDDISQKIIVEA